MTQQKTTKRYAFLLPLLATFLVVGLNACKKNDTPVPPPYRPDIDFFATTSTNQLLKYNAKSVEMPKATLSVTGLQSGETLLGIDFRPATGQLYGLGSTSRLYVINTETGAARAIGTAPFTPALGSNYAAFDFNPTVDRIRVVTSVGQNLRLNPETGTVVATDGSINAVTDAAVTAAAYSGNKAGSSATVLYDIDLTTKKLYRQTPPNNGTLVEIGSLGVMATGEAGFDISPDGAVALAGLTVSGKSSLYQVDTTSGKAYKLGDFGGLASGALITGIAIPTEPVAYAVDQTNNLLIFNPTKTTAPVSKVITGIQDGENILGIDFRPLNGQLYALGSSSKIYTLNTSSGVAVAVGIAPFATLLSGTSFGFDFNPTVDRIRIVSDNGQNIRVHPETGLIAAVDLPLNPGTPMVSAAAYTNNFAGATTTVLFDLDATTDKLYMQTPPNNGTLVEVGPLGIDIESANGFDIGGTSGKAYAIFSVGAGNAVYSINLATGAATKLVDFSKPVRGMAVGLGF